MSIRRACRDCLKMGVSTGDCPYCDGTGANPQLDAANPKCPRCGGTGRCATCNGTGMTGGSEIQTLFDS